VEATFTRPILPWETLPISRDQVPFPFMLPWKETSLEGLFGPSNLQFTFHTGTEDGFWVEGTTSDSNAPLQHALLTYNSATGEASGEFSFLNGNSSTQAFDILGQESWMVSTETFDGNDSLISVERINRDSTVTSTPQPRRPLRRSGR
jgi:hypothetical protein